MVGIVKILCQELVTQREYADIENNTGVEMGGLFYCTMWVNSMEQLAGN